MLIVILLIDMEREKINKMKQETLNKIELWKQNVSSEELLEISQMSETELEDAFTEDIAFGTAGLRGIIGVGSNRMNVYVVRKTTLGFMNYMKMRQSNACEMGVAIAYDCRRNSDVFSKAAACVLASGGMKVYLFSALRPTPELSFAVRHLKCAGGIMITASHNPPQYNGYKVYDEEGCQLIPELADSVTNEVNSITDMFNINTKSFEEYVSEGLIKVIDKEVDVPYLEQVRTIPVNNVKKDNIKIVYTPLHGTGSAFMVELLQSEGYNVIPVKEQMIPDGEFSTLKSPNPEDESAFEYSLKLGKETNADILIATDPDADRMGIAAKDDNGEYVLLTGNQTGAILLNYLALNVPHDQNSCVYNTIVTSNIAKDICEKHNLTLVQTLTGFKYIGEQAALIENTEKKFFFGYEESYGSVIKPFVRDKDSFQATLLLAEVASYYKEQGKTLVNVLNDIYEEYGYYLEGVQNISLTGLEGALRIKKIMAYFQNNPLHEVAGRKIVTIEDYDKSESITGDVKARIKLPKSLVLKYIFADGGWFALRPSGTEPKLKIYIAIKDENKVAAFKFIEQLKKDVMSIIDTIK